MRGWKVWMQGLAVLALLNPGYAQVPASRMRQSLGKLEGQLNILAWPGYIERGQSDPNYDWVTPFEKATGCKVNVKVFASSDEAVALMNQGGYDLVTASGDATLRLIYGNKVQPVNYKLVPSTAKLDKRLRNGPWYVVNGVPYGVPYQWGPNVLAYNTKVFPTPPTSWKVVFEETMLPDGKSNKGRVQAYYGPIYVADAALYLMKTRPDLGIKDPYELNEKQYQAVLGLLRQQRKIVQRYWSDANQQVQDFINEGVVAAPSWPFQVNTLKAGNHPVSSTIPKEGATGWADTTMMHVDAKNPNCAYKWLEWSLNPKVQGDIAAWFGSNPVVPEGCTASALLGKEGCAANGFNDFDKIYFWKTPVANCKTQGQCVPYSRWVRDYIAIQGGK
ncbi:spermidine/putrescine ABC transporter substrate-binding protein [Thermus scotoductus]|uniref:Spermidine/putrescine ABC transporter substrate-binding protein n=1 Tax=Thermus scotoductus TaxID=37636 RepID=A0A430SDE0_THESC|nr:ABC transporter substrate-binding protein [Thermus scotoductus]RTG96577.1 spermidine/putrescine ABC transporter substrate-binding protein [Thermus scotoductus]RTH11282.1 spermidine/putrescine ABC transporter substrate-binding protein [Thermus scotoductus]RTH12773.1 spermidine/putrescine ABC transporter substrate-binding protein [Thermus scotoductus]RTH13802.1 spermidine/putrescine ABC transporter substrate-binding protein [Thermus scotoductus]RTH19638.1 spermidine/putrescine ABC transporter